MKMDLTHKVVNGLERISEVFKTLLWEKAKVYGLSPIQIQILLFLADHKLALCNVSHLAKEFNLAKPTISDAVRALNAKGLVEKDHSVVDGRSYTLVATQKGKALMGELITYTLPLEKQVDSLDEEKLSSLFSILSELLYKLHRSGVLTVQRTCFGCRFYDTGKSSHYCNLLQKPLQDQEIRLDCPEYEAKNA